jgi:hypothetical protein
MAKPLKSLAKSKATTTCSEPPSRRARRIKVASRGSSAEAGYTAPDIEVLEGLEPVRRRPGMYIGGTDEKALHHLFAEVIDNCMDEALAGHATFIEVECRADGFLTVTDNGRGIPVDPHPNSRKSRRSKSSCARCIPAANSTRRLRNLRRLARRRRLRRERPLLALEVEGRAQLKSSTA